MARTLGLIGGTGPEATIAYYRLLIAKYREQTDGNGPPLIINSVNLKSMMEWMAAGELDKVADSLSTAIDQLHRAGADFAPASSSLRPTPKNRTTVFQRFLDRITGLPRFITHFAGSES